MSKQRLLGPKETERLNRYDQHMAVVASSHGDATTAISKYWWNLYLIRRDEEWRARYKKFIDWLGDFCAEPFGESQQTYYNVMGAIEHWMALGATEQDVKYLLGNRKVALEGDLDEWFRKNGKGEALRPEIAEKLEKLQETPRQMLRRVAELPPGEARQAMRDISGGEYIYFTDSSYDPKTGILLANVRHESTDRGLLWTGTLTITGIQVKDGHTVKGSMLPEMIAQFMVSKFGIQRRSQ